jgi:glutathione S-transferase
MIRFYHDPISAPCRAIALYAAEAGLMLEVVPINLAAKDQLADWFVRLNPNHAVPVIAHDDFVLTESPAILKYLAALTPSHSYPDDLQKRGRIDEMLNWFATGFTEDFVHGLCYVHIIPKYQVPAADLSGHLQRTHAYSEARLGVLDTWIGANPFLCGKHLTIADCYGAALITMGDFIGYDFSPWPNVERWIAAMKQRPGWTHVNAVFYRAIDMAAQTRASA